MAINNIINGESGLSIRTKLNSVINRMNAETVYDITGNTIDAYNGVIQLKTLNSDITFVTSFLSGQIVLLHIFNGSTYNILWPNDIVWLNDSAPVLTNADVIKLWKVNETLYGEYSGSIES